MHHGSKPQAPCTSPVPIARGEQLIPFDELDELDPLTLESRMVMIQRGVSTPKQWSSHYHNVMMASCGIEV